MSSPGVNPFRIWLLPLSILLGAALAIFVFTFWVDASSAPDPSRVVSLIFEPNAQSAASTIGNAAELAAAVLAIAITVVAIVVELAANRYTHRITELFVSTPINFAVMGFFVVTSLVCLWVSTTFDDAGSGFVPLFGFAVSMIMLALCLLLLLPYFAFVFAFLNPIQIVDRIRRHTMNVLKRRAAAGSVAMLQKEAIRGIEQIADVALNAMENKDKGVSMASVDALAAMVLDYEELRDELPPAWFNIEGDLAHNPDFVSMAPAVLDDVSRRRIWFEMKVLRQYQTIYNEALNKMRDIDYVIAIDTRRIATRASEQQNKELFDLTLKFFNTYLRATINARDVRTAYNVLNQYRLLAEAVLDEVRGARAIEIARYFKYYGLTAYGAKLPFILETIAYDLCALCELAFDRKSPAAPELLRIFLQVDKESEGEVQEQSLRGVRKAQVKLATHYLVCGDEKLARDVYRDMEKERPERLASIRDELLGVSSAEFWEISDRGINFDYLPPQQKYALITFFEWFGDRLGPPRASRLPDSGPPPAPAPEARDSDYKVPSLHDGPPRGRHPADSDPDAQAPATPGAPSARIIQRPE